MNILIFRRVLFVLLGVLTAGACVTVNIYFPAAEVEEAAKDVVSDVYGGEQNGEELQQAPGDSSGIWRALAGALAPRAAYAQNATTVSNAAIRGLKAEIARNHRQLAPFYNKGAVGITKDGLLAVRNTKGLAVPQVGQLRRLVSADNKARGQLYKEVAKALKVDPSQVGRIQEIFAREWQGQARKGWQVQRPNGSWGAK